MQSPPIDQERVQQAKREINTMTEQIRNMLAEKNDADLKEKGRSVPPLERVRLTCRRELRGHLGKVNALHWSEDNTHLVSAAQDGKLLVWDAASMNKVHAITLQCAWVMTCAYSPSGGLVAAGGLDNICSVYNLRAREQPLRTYRQLHGHTGFISCVRFLNDRQLLTASGDASCALWDIDSQARLLPFQGHLHDVMALAVAPDKNTFATGACDRAAKLWDVRTGRCVQSFSNAAPAPPLYGDVNAVAWFPTGTAFAAGSDDGLIRLYDIRAARELCTYAAEPAAAVTSVGFSGSGRLLFAGYDSTAALVWDTLRGERVAALAGHEARVSCVGVPPNGTAVATGSWDHKIRVWA